MFSHIKEYFLLVMYKFAILTSYAFIKFIINDDFERFTPPSRFHNQSLGIKVKLYKALNNIIEN